jgi:subtilase family serine protease
LRVPWGTDAKEKQMKNLWILACAAFVFAACGGTSAPRSASGSDLTSAASNGDFEYIVNPLRVQADAAEVTPDRTRCQNGAFGCYSPGPVRAAYNVPSTLDGTGQTILIVDAFGSPTIARDLAIFDKAFGLPDPPSFTILCPEDGCPAFDPSDTHHDQIGWSVETSLDVEWAHAIAPGAHIVLVVASTSSGNAINAAEARAIGLFPGSVMSQSFGVPEFVVHANNSQLMQGIKNYELARAANITVLASAGDSGATNGASFANAGFPASDPLNTAVGGTMGNPYPFGLVAGAGTSASPFHYGGEQVWNEGPPVLSGGAAGGGAPSLFFGVPDFQAGLGLSARAIPDVSYNAAVDGGVLVTWSVLFPPGSAFIVGGTSAGAPQWAGIIALANQYNNGPLGFINPALYKLLNNATTYGRDFHDIKVGNNRLLGTPVGFSAATGWDDATGIGTPNVANLIPDLVAAAK